MKVGRDDAGYPQALRSLPRAPEQLYVQGTLASGKRRVAIVGARVLPPGKAHFAREAAALLARAGIEVVSGGARGADTAAHQGALDAGGTTVAVMAGGLDRLYPRENSRLFQTIQAGQGALVSEHPNGTEPLRQMFPSRNRIVSGLCEAVVVVHASKESGSLYTADAARVQKRRLFAVPGGEGNEGAEQLLADGHAEPLATPDDLRTTLGLAASEEPPPKLAGDEQTLYALLHRGPMHLDQLRASSKLPSGALFLALGRLEVENRIVAQPGNFYRKR